MTQISLMRQRLNSFFSSFSTSVSTSSIDGHSSYSRSFFAPRKMKRYFKKSIYLPVVIVFVVLAVIVLGFRIYYATQASKVVQASTVQSVAPTVIQTLNKTFNFPLTDANGNTISKFAYTIQSVQEQNQILIKGETASAVAGTTFLIVNLQITNNYSKDFSLDTRDYVRLIEGNSTQKLAPELYNDPVQVQAISTTFTKIGFPIATNAKDLKLQVGQITGNKSTINLSI